MKWYFLVVINKNKKLAMWMTTRMRDHHATCFVEKMVAQGEAISIREYTAHKGGENLIAALASRCIT